MHHTARTERRAEIEKYLAVRNSVMLQHVVLAFNYFMLRVPATALGRQQQSGHKFLDPLIHLECRRAVYLIAAIKLRIFTMFRSSWW